MEQEKEWEKGFRERNRLMERKRKKRRIIGKRGSEEIEGVGEREREREREKAKV